MQNTCRNHGELVSWIAPLSTAHCAGGNLHACLLVPVELARAKGLTNAIQPDTESVRQSETTPQGMFKGLGGP